METKWLVRAASLAVVGGLTWSNQAQAQTQPPSQKAAEDDGPFAPKGKTGKLREAEQAENAPKPEPEAPPPAEKKYGVGADIVYGIGESGSGTETGSTPVEYKVASMILAATYQADPKIGARFRVPVSNGSMGASVGSTDPYSASALGNIELGMTYTSEMGPRTRLPFDVGLYIPVANGDRFPPPEDPARFRTFRVNTAAQWSRGMEEDALFAPHRLSLVPGLALRSSSGGMTAGGYVKLPLMLRMGGQEPPTLSANNDLYSLKAVVFEAILGGDFRIDVSRNKMDIGARAWLTWMSSEFVQRDLAGTTAPSRLQITVEPQFRAMFGQLKAVLGVILPIEGRLASGDLQNAYGFRLAAIYGF